MSYSRVQWPSFTAPPSQPDYTRPPAAARQRRSASKYCPVPRPGSESRSPGSGRGVITRILPGRIFCEITSHGAWHSMMKLCLNNTWSQYYLHNMCLHFISQHRSLDNYKTPWPRFVLFPRSPAPPSWHPVCLFSDLVRGRVSCLCWFEHFRQEGSGSQKQTDNL